MRRLAENPYVQTAFHVAGGIGLGVFLAPFLPQKAAMLLSVILLSAAILGHWYAVVTDPSNRGPREH